MKRERRLPTEIRRFKKAFRHCRGNVGKYNTCSRCPVRGKYLEDPSTGTGCLIWLAGDSGFGMRPVKEWKERAYQLCFDPLYIDMLKAKGAKL